MLQYNIHLKTINDFKKYADMIVRFNLAGFIDVKNDRIDMYDILELMSMSSVHSMMMNLTRYSPDQIPELETYLENTHLLLQ